MKRCSNTNASFKLRQQATFQQNKASSELDRSHCVQQGQSTHREEKLQKHSVTSNLLSVVSPKSRRTSMVSPVDYTTILSLEAYTLT